MASETPKFDVVFDQAQEKHLGQGRWEGNPQELTTTEMLVLAAGHLNYVIGRGGFRQWIDDGYGKRDGYLLLGWLSQSNDNAVCSEVAKLINKAMAVAAVCATCGDNGPDNPSWDIYGALGDDYADLTDATDTDDAVDGNAFLLEIEARLEIVLQ